MVGWRHLELDAALALLETWIGRPVLVSVDLTAGPPGLAGMTGLLRRGAGPDEGIVEFEIEGAEAWFRLPSGRCFRGAAYTPEDHVLVLEYGDEHADPASGVLVDVQLLSRRPAWGAGGTHQSGSGALYPDQIAGGPPAS